MQSRATDRTLSQRRADFRAQMRDMALSDLSDVAARLRELHERLNRKTGRKWTEKEITDATKIPMRTYQTWTGARNENSDGKGYEALAQFYRRKLDDKTITRNWIVFGRQDPPKAPDLMSMNGDEEQAQRVLDPVFDRFDQLDVNLARVETHLQALDDRLLAIVADLETLRSAVRSAQPKETKAN